MDEQIDGLLKKAQRYLQSAAVLLELEDFDSCASRAYFAMLYSVQALLLRDGRPLPGPVRVRSTFMETYVVTGRLPERVGMLLQKGSELQEVADYGLKFAVSRESAEAVLQEAEAFTNSLARLVTPE